MTIKQTMTRARPRWVLSLALVAAALGCESHNRNNDGSSGSGSDTPPPKNDGFFLEICQRTSNPLDIQQTVDALKALANTSDCGTTNDYFAEQRTLNLSGKAITNLLPIKGMKVLSELILDDNQIDSLDPLSDLRHLTLLSVANNKIKSVSPLSMLDKLHTLVLDRNGIDSIFALRTLPSVQRFSMSDNPLGGGPIKKNTGNCDPKSKSPAIASWCSPATAFLRICNEGSSADKDDRHTVDVIKAQLKATSCDEANRKLTQLTTLKLPLKQLVSVAPLRGLRQLQFLDLSYNFITEIGPLSDLEQLTTLLLYSNRIENIVAIQHMKKLSTLNLSFNYIKDFLPLRDLRYLVNAPEATDLKAFRAEYNPLGCREFLESTYCRGERLPIERTKYNCPFDAASHVVAEWCRYGPNRLAPL